MVKENHVLMHEHVTEHVLQPIWQLVWLQAVGENNTNEGGGACGTVQHSKKHPRFVGSKRV